MMHSSVREGSTAEQELVERPAFQTTDGLFTTAKDTTGYK